MTTFSLFTMTNMSHDINGQFSLLTQFSILHDAHLNDKGGYSKKKKINMSLIRFKGIRKLFIEESLFRKKPYCFLILQLKPYFQGGITSFVFN